MKQVMEELAPYWRGWRGYFGFWRNPFGVAAFGFVDQEAHTLCLLATVEDRPQAVRGTAPAGRERGGGGENR